MKTLFTTIALFLTIHMASFGQSENISVGAGLSFHNEITKISYWDDEKTKSFDQSFGTGIRLIKQFKSDWGLKIELDYTRRRYAGGTYDPCYFSVECLTAFFPLKSYGYHTIEPTVGVIRYFKRNEKWQTYISFNLGEAFSFKSFYNTEDQGKLSLNELNVFSGSLTCNLGFERILSEQIRLSIEPFIRLLHVQRNDRAVVGRQKKLTAFDNFGVQLFLMRGL